MRNLEGRPRVIDQGLQDLAFQPQRGIRAHWAIVPRGGDSGEVFEVVSNGLVSTEGEIDKDLAWEIKDVARRTGESIRQVEARLHKKFLEEGQKYRLTTSDHSDIVYIHGQPPQPIGDGLIDA